MTVIVDTSDLDRLAVDLGKAGLATAVKVGYQMERSGQRIEAEAKALAPKTGLPHYADTITHEIISEHAGVVVVEIGPDRSINGQAKLAHLWEYGTPDRAPRQHLGPAFDREVPNFVDKVSDAGGDIL